MAEPNQDQALADEFRKLTALRAEMAQLLGDLDRTSTCRCWRQPSTVDAPDMVPHECWHPTADHGEWGCTVRGCKCPRARHTFDHPEGES